MAIKRPRGYCPACDTITEWYTDGMGAPQHPWRCGNCFQGATDEQLQRFELAYKKLQEHEDQRQEILDDALRG